MSAPSGECRVCGASDVARSLDCRERMFGLDGHFTYTLCAACGSLSQTEQDFEVAKYYPTQYYSFSTGADFPFKAKAASFIGRMLPASLATVTGKISYSVGQVARVRAEITGWFGAPRQAPRLLDVGCGSGAGLLCYHYAGCQVEGLDPFYQGANPPQFPIHRMLLAELSGCYDVITFNHSLEHVPEPGCELVNDSWGGRTSIGRVSSAAGSRCRLRRSSEPGGGWQSDGRLEAGCRRVSVVSQRQPPGNLRHDPAPRLRIRTPL